MRVKEKIENIDYNETKQFFKNRLVSLEQIIHMR